jgi:hypothetical protein
MVLHVDTVSEGNAASFLKVEVTGMRMQEDYSCKDRISSK